jgi:hypothetical protein
VPCLVTRRQQPNELVLAAHSQALPKVKHTPVLRSYTLVPTLFCELSLNARCARNRLGGCKVAGGSTSSTCHDRVRSLVWRSGMRMVRFPNPVGQVQGMSVTALRKQAMPG